MARPRVLLNCACSLDGKLAAADGGPLPFSDETDWRRVHRLRAESYAVLVGVGTILQDDPALKVKEEFAPLPPGRRLRRVILDTQGRTPPSARAVDGSAPSLVVTAPGVPSRWPRAEHATVPMAEGRLDLGAALGLLEARGDRQVLVEGGGRVLRSFLDAGLAERWTLYVAPVLVGGDGPSIFPGRPSPIGRRLHVENVQPQGKGVLWTLRP